jgi:RimJ/RimL family protein N-acetyltransferase
MNEIIPGLLVCLRPATLADRQPIFSWLAQSDLTAQMLGPPRYPDNLVPTWEEFVTDYVHYFFDGSQPLLGRCFIIEVNSEPVGQVNYSEIWADGSTELDIWLRDSTCTGKGYGPDALQTLCRHLNQQFSCRTFFIAPSARNTPAVNAYGKAGFRPATQVPAWLVPDYDDTVVLVKNI